jgi:hypothetical protein
LRAGCWRHTWASPFTVLGPLCRAVQTPCRTPRSLPDGYHAVSADPVRRWGQPSSAVGSPPRCHRCALQLLGRGVSHHTHHRLSPGQSVCQSDRATGRPGTDRRYLDRSASCFQKDRQPGVDSGSASENPQFRASEVTGLARRRAPSIAALRASAAGILIRKWATATLS